MMKKVVVLLVAACVFLSGCQGLMSGSYRFSQPHETQGQQQVSAAVKDYSGLRQALTELVSTNTVNGKIAVTNYDAEKLRADLDRAIGELMGNNAMVAYAVRDIAYQIGPGTSPRMVAITVDYHQNRKNIQHVSQITMAQAETVIARALDACDADVVFHVSDYEKADFALMVDSYAQKYPDRVMEIPQVTVNIYPDIGKSRVVELVFTYQTSRDALRAMREYVQQVMEASRLNVMAEENPSVRYSLLYSFLAERNAIKPDASITTAYSVLRYGVGDSRAFAQVFAAMCRDADLTCMVVSGTCNGQSHFWNIIQHGGVYYHVDIFRDWEKRELTTYTDSEMTGYVWDFQAYPPCGQAPAPI